VIKRNVVEEGVTPCSVPGCPHGAVALDSDQAAKCAVHLRVDKRSSHGTGDHPPVQDLGSDPALVSRFGASD